MPHLKDGEDFSFPKEFGFHGSANPVHKAQGGSVGNTTALSERGMPATAIKGEVPEHVPEGHEAHALSGEHEGHDEFAHGGSTHHLHPHGHDVVHVHHDRASGAVIHHHAHGGYTVHHADGHVTHHDAHGGHVHHAEHHAHGGHQHHPDGHNPVRVEHHPDGSHTVRHAHGGFTHHHADGSVSHHDAQGGHVGMAHGGHHPGEGTYLARHASGGHSDAAADKKMIAKGIHQHEDHEHHGEHTDLELARGGATGLKARIPRGMRPRTATEHSPINTAPRPPRRNPTPRNNMPGDVMPYGVEPSSEPDTAGSDQGIPQMSRGGKAKC